MTTFPLYPRNRPLKDVLLASKKLGEKSLIVLEWSVYGVPSRTLDLTEDSVEKRLYNAVTEYFYYADISADDDEMFKQRFTNLWNIHSPEYIKVLNTLLGYNGDTETLVIDGTNTKQGGRDNEKNDSGSEDDIHNENRTMKKGVSTSSTQSNSNEGNKLTRATPNEQMTVSGSATTTVTDSGQDEDTLAMTIGKDYQSNQTENETYNETLNVDTTNSRSKLSADIIAKLSEFNGIVMDFVWKFEKLFMEVL